MTTDLQTRAYEHFTDTDHVPELPYKDDCYSYHVQTFRDWMSETGRTDPIAAVGDYFRDLNASHYAAGTVRMKRSAVKNRLVLMADARDLSLEDRHRFERLMHRLDTDPETKAPKRNTNAVGSGKVITETEYDRLLLGARSERQTLFIRFLWQTGCRVSEMTGSELRNCKREGPTVAIRVMGKGRKERTVRITADLFDTIRATFRAEEFLFETSTGKPYRRSYVSEQIAKLTTDIIGRRLSAHSLRHSFVTRMIRKHPDKISAVSTYAGHSSTSITLDMYDHAELTDADLFGAEAVV